jgi:Zn-dependent peptidase ImmA (M78 family)
MTKSIPALAEPQMLRWTRENSGVDFEAIARRIGADEATVKDWEAGKGHPTMSQLRKLGELYKFAIAVFYLPEPPEDATKMKDCRRLPKGRRSEFSPKLRYLIRHTRYRQDWLREYRQANDFPEIKFVGSQSDSASASELGKSIRTTLGVSIDDQRNWINKDYASRAWLQRVESLGICVFQSSGVSVNEMRGFALPDPIAPVVMINSKDSRAARIFTLLHEVAHVALGRSGISNMVPGQNGEDQRVEVLCNAAAAEALVPADDFRLQARSKDDIRSDEAIKELSAYYRVSEEVVVGKLFDLKFVTREFYELKRAEYANRRPAKSKQKNIPRWGQVVVKNNGRAFSATAISAFNAGEIGGSELSDLLEMKVDHLRQVEAEL